MKHRLRMRIGAPMAERATREPYSRLDNRREVEVSSFFPS